jgi:hypothetical protein
MCLQHVQINVLSIRTGQWETTMRFNTRRQPASSRKSAHRAYRGEIDKKKRKLDETLRPPETPFTVIARQWVGSNGAYRSVGVQSF